MEHYADFLRRRPGWIVAFVLVMSAVALFGLTRLRFDGVPRAILYNDDEGFHRLERFYEEFGSDDNDALVVLEARDWLTPEGVALLRRAADALRAVGGLEAVHGLDQVLVFDAGPLPQPLLPSSSAPASAFETARKRAAAHPLVGGRSLSMDRTTALFVARVAGDALSIQELDPVVGALEAVCAQIDGVKVDGSAVRARLTGVPSVRVEIYETIRFEQVLFMGLASSVCLVLAWFLFKSIAAVLAACLPPLVGSFWALGFIGLAGAKIDILGTVLPLLVIVIGFTDSMHLLIDARVTLGRGRSNPEAAVDAVRHLGMPCFLTSLTTAVGFASLGLANIEAIRRFGLLCSVSVVLAFLAVITIQPLSVRYLRGLGTEPAPNDRRNGGVVRVSATRLIDFVLAHARLVTIGGVLVTLLCVGLSSRLVPENRLLEAMPSDSAATRALLHCEEVFGGVLPAHTVVDWSGGDSVELTDLLDVLAATEAEFEALGVRAGMRGLERPLSIRSLLASLPNGLARPEAALALLPEDATRRLLRTDLERAVVSVQVPDEGSEVILPLYAEMELALERIESRFPAFELYLTGTDLIARTYINRMIGDLARSLGFAAVLIFCVIALEFRSIRLGLLSLLPNVFPLAVIGALLVVAGLPLQMGTAVLFTVLLGLAVDDTIHFLARHRREQRAGSAEPLRTAFFSVGRAIVLTTVVLSVGVSVVLTSSVPTNRLFGALHLVGLAAALVGDLVLLPALLATFPGRRGARKERPVPSRS